MSMGGNKRLSPSEEDENILRVLPSHITLEILSRLPLKTIIHCSCVCKAWRAILLDPSFSQIHLPKSSISLMLRSSPSYRLIEFDQDFCKWNMFKFKDECMLSSEPTSVVGSCNGLICLKAVMEKKEQHYYVWNPIKNDNVILPMPSLNYTDKDCFGYCPRTNVYKVIRMVTFGAMGSSNTAMCEVCTLGTNAWRTIQDVPCPDDEYDGVNSIWKMSFNGAIHWFCSSKINDGDDFPIWICAFKIEDEKWDPIFLPLPLLEVPHSEFNYLAFELGVLKNCLSIFIKLEDSLLDVWIMKDYGVTESWTKCWSIESDMPLELHVPSLLPLKLTNEGDLLMFDMFNKALICFNTKKSLITHKQWIDGVPGGDRGIPYVASFISPTQVMN